MGCQNGVLSLSNPLSIHNSYREGRLCGRMESSPFPVHFLYTTHIEKADSLSEWPSKNKETLRKTNIYQTTAFQKTKTLSKTNIHQTTAFQKPRSIKKNQY